MDMIYNEVLPIELNNIVRKKQVNNQNNDNSSLQRNIDKKAPECSKKYR
jgi:hypothetical protein